MVVQAMAGAGAMRFAVFIFAAIALTATSARAEWSSAPAQRLVS